MYRHLTFKQGTIIKILSLRTQAELVLVGERALEILSLNVEERTADASVKRTEHDQ